MVISSCYCYDVADILLGILHNPSYLILTTTWKAVMTIYVWEPRNRLEESVSGHIWRGTSHLSSFFIPQQSHLGHVTKTVLCKTKVSKERLVSRSLSRALTYWHPQDHERSDQLLNWQLYFSDFTDGWSSTCSTSVGISKDFSPSL